MLSSNANECEPLPRIPLIVEADDVGFLPQVPGCRGRGRPSAVHVHIRHERPAPVGRRQRILEDARARVVAPHAHAADDVLVRLRPRARRGIPPLDAAPRVARSASPILPRPGHLPSQPWDRHPLCGVAARA